MSAIFGKINADGEPVAEDIGLMLAAMHQWQADDTGTWGDGSAGLGHLMLYNTPESLKEKLPLCDGLAQLAITADARIDNRDELYGLLGISTPAERQLPDSSLILLAYKKYGAGCVHHLVGDFAFAIWDARQQTLFCARDQMGVKPFFYCDGDCFFAFATEKKGILCLPGVDKTVNKDYFYNHLLKSLIQAADTTIYKHIHRLPAAHTLTYDSTKRTTLLHKYWTLDATTEIKFERHEDYYDGIRSHFEEAVKCRLRSGYNIGVELSGGLDSSAIAGVAAHLLRQQHKQIFTFSASGDDDSPKALNGRIYEDDKYIKAVIEFNKISTPVFVNKNLWDDPIDEVDFNLKVNDGLEEYNQSYLHMIKNEAMQRGVRTLFSGFPGDEMVTYRGLYYFFDYLDKGQYLKYFKAKKTAPFSKFKPFIGPGMEYLGHKMRNLLTLFGDQNRFASGFFPVPLRNRLIKGDAMWTDASYRERYKSYRHFQKFRLLKPMISMRMENETRFGLYFKTEPCYPMADIRLTQFFLSLPNPIKYEGAMERSAWRRVMKDYVPPELLQRADKFGIMAPFRFNAHVVQRQKESMMQMLNSLSGKHEYNADRVMQSFGSKRNIIKYIEILRWMEKNFESL